MSGKIIEILSSIRQGTSYTGKPQSRIEAILTAIANGKAYTDIPKSRHEKLLLAIKNKSTVTFAPRTRVEKILTEISKGTLSTYLKGKNLFDISKIQSNSDLTNKGDGTLVISAGSYYTRTKTTLRELCPLLKAGDTCILQFDTDSDKSTFFYPSVEWYSGTSKVLTDKILDDHLILYGYHSSEAGYGSECRISNIKIELGTNKTPYTPYEFKSDLEEAYCLTGNKLKGV